MPAECEFAVHLGDFKSELSNCTEDVYQNVDSILSNSSIPLFLVVGDNGRFRRLNSKWMNAYSLRYSHIFFLVPIEWNDCPGADDPEKADQYWQYWVQYFNKYDERHWQVESQVLGVSRQTFPVAREENFYFILKRTLFIGLNIVGGRVLDAGDWQVRLEANFEWIKDLMLDNLPSNADGVVLMAHAKETQSPSSNAVSFFNPLATFLSDPLNGVDIYPVLYLHGDGHFWKYDTTFLGVPNLLSIQHRGGTSEPVLIMKVDTASSNDTATAFQYDRQL
jgi:hypothetical protein